MPSSVFQLAVRGLELFRSLGPAERDNFENRQAEQDEGDHTTAAVRCSIARITAVMSAPPRPRAWVST